MNGSVPPVLTTAFRKENCMPDIFKAHFSHFYGHCIIPQKDNLVAIVSHLASPFFLYDIFTQLANLSFSCKDPICGC